MTGREGKSSGKWKERLGVKGRVGKGKLEREENKLLNLTMKVNR